HWIFVAKISSRKRFVDQNHGRTSAIVSDSERSAPSNRNLQRLEISRRNVTKLDRENGPLGRRPAAQPEITRVARPAPVLKRQQLRKAGGSHAGKLRDPLGHLIELAYVGPRRHPLTDV